MKHTGKATGRDTAMTIVDQIQQRVRKLPVTSQVEVLDFAEYLLSKIDREMAGSEDEAWRDLSLTSAMRGMEDEQMPEYTTNDLKTKFS